MRLLVSVPPRQVLVARVRGGGTLRGMGKIQLRHRFEDIISVQNLLEAWSEFVRGKRGRRELSVEIAVGVYKKKDYRVFVLLSVDDAEVSSYVYASESFVRSSEGVIV